jgi:hypothetical protein
MSVRVRPEAPYPCIFEKKVYDKDVMETNILQALVLADKKVREKLKKLQEEYDEFLKNLPQYKVDEEKKFLKKFNQNVDLLKKEYEEKFLRAKEKVNAMNPSHNHFNVEDESKTIQSLFEGIIKAK